MSYLNLISTFIITSLSLFALQPMASRVGLVDIPGGRKTHQMPTPLIGGLGIYVGVLSISLFSPLILQHYSALFALSALVLCAGMLDDVRELKVSVRMGMHAFAAWLMIMLANNQLLSFGNLLAFGPIELGLMALPLTLFATVGVINAVNMSDGVDGLSGSLVLVALFCLGVVAFMANDLPMLQLITLLICGVLAFLMMNFRLPWKQPALVYLGDAGSTMLGFMLAWLLIEASQGDNANMSPVYALWFLAVPLIDTVSLMIIRPLRGLSPFTAGTDHLHHCLLRAGYTHKQVVISLFGTSALMGSIGLLGYLNQTSEAFMFLLFMSVFSAYLTWRKLSPVAGPE
jgi:UDP-GlcNAc:undecaprenyl-phosphate GlcNAc-1-phosphate transferase